MDGQAMPEPKPGRFTGPSLKAEPPVAPLWEREPPVLSRSGEEPAAAAGPGGSERPAMAPAAAAAGAADEPIMATALRQTPELPGDARHERITAGMARRAGWWPAILAAAVGCAGGAAWSEVRLRDALVMRPPLVAVDYRPILQQLAGGQDAAALAPEFAAYKARAAAFRRAGYLVFNRATLEAIPDALLIPPPAVVKPPAGPPVGPSGAPVAAVAPALPAPPVAATAPLAAPQPVAAAAGGARTELSAAEAGALLRAILQQGGQK